MIKIVFTVIEVKKYSSTHMIWVKTSEPQNSTNGRFFVKDSNIWRVGNRICRTCKRVDKITDLPNTSYVQMGSAIYQIQDTLL